MKKALVLYWSGTGNTEKMAYSVLRGIRDGMAEGELVHCQSFKLSMLEEYDSFAFGCPATGNEELEESEFEPVFSQIEPYLMGKRIALFGSYGWGGGIWMKNWEARCRDAGSVLVSSPVICCDEPDSDTLAALEGLGKILAEKS